jgi:hypothetical protein
MLTFGLGGGALGSVVVLGMELVLVLDRGGFICIDRVDAVGLDMRLRCLLLHFLVISSLLLRLLGR